MIVLGGLYVKNKVGAVFSLAGDWPHQCYIVGIYDHLELMDSSDKRTYRVSTEFFRDCYDLLSPPKFVNVEVFQLNKRFFFKTGDFLVELHGYNTGGPLSKE